MEKCKAYFLSDTPASDDAFGAHKQIADAIVDLTEDGNGGKAIALFGDWGSGKSTIVGFIKNHFKIAGDKGNIKEKVFVFDAWAHQGDPLRRSFLESLAEALVPWTEKNEWDAELGRLSRKIVDTETKSEPTITLLGKVILFLLLFYPVGFSFFGTLASKDYASLPKWYYPLWIWGIIILLLPFVVAVLGCLCNKIFGNKSEDYFSLFFTKTTSNHKTTSVTTPDPTTIEFQEVLKRMLGKVLGTNGRRLVVVVDNLDRVDTKDALSIWATMRTLFEFDASQKMAWADYFWLIVPMDKSALTRLWDGSVVKREKETARPTLVDAFVEKTFQMEFYVPPPVLSQLKTYFMEQLKVAFPSHAADENELLTVFRLYRQRVVAKQGRVTPRDVKLFINRVVSVHLLWGDEIPLTSQALYVLYSESIRSSEKGLITWDFIEPRIQNVIFWPDWQKDLIALHFGVKKDDGLQVLIGQKVEENLTTGRSLKDFCHVPGFYDLLEDIIIKNHEAWAKEEPASLALSAVAIESLGEDAKLVSSSVWEWLSLSIGKVSGWQNLDSSVGKGIVLIFKNTRQEELESVAKNVVGSLTDKPWGAGVSPNVKVLRGWADSVSQIVEYLSAIDAKVSLDNLKIPGSEKDFIEIAAVVAEGDKSDLLKPYLIPKAGKVHVINELVRECQSGVFREREAGLLNFLAKIWPDEKWDTLINTISNRIGTEIALPELVGCLKALLLRRDEDATAKNLLTAFCVNGHIPHYLARIDPENPKANALVVMAMFLVQAAGGNNTNTRNSNAGRANYKAILASPDAHPALLSEFLKLVVEMSVVEKLFEIKTTAPITEKFVSRLINLLVESGEFIDHLTAPMFLGNADYLRKVLAESNLSSLMAQLVGHTDIVGDIIANGFDRNHAWLYSLILKQKGKASDAEYVQFLVKSIRPIPKEVWAEEIGKEGDCLGLVLQLVESGAAIGLSQEFHDALNEHAEKLVVGAQAIAKYKGQWTRLLEGLESDWRKTLRLTLRDKMISHSKEKLELFLSVYTPVLSDSELFVKDGDRVIRVLASDIIGKKIESELAWLETILSDGKILNASEKETKHSFKERVRNVAGDQSLSEGVKLHITSIEKLTEQSDPKDK